MKKLWQLAQKLARPFDPEIVKAEPALAAAVVGVVGDLAASLGFHLSGTVTSWLAGLTLLVVGAFTRQRVTPVRRVRLDRVDDGAVYPPSAAMVRHS